MAGWTTMEDVINDMPSVPGVGAWDDRFLIRAGQPPPPRRDMDVDDDEFQLRFGATTNQLGHGDSMAPDLDGIRKMLRMVNDDEEDNGNRYRHKREGSLDYKKNTPRILITKRPNDNEQTSPRRTMFGKTHGSNQNVHRLVTKPNGFTENWRARDSPNERIERKSPHKVDANKSPETPIVVEKPSPKQSTLNPNVPVFVPKFHISNSFERNDAENVNPTSSVQNNSLLDEDIPQTVLPHSILTPTSLYSCDYDKTSLTDKPSSATTFTSKDEAANDIVSSNAEVLRESPKDKMSEEFQTSTPPTVEKEEVQKRNESPLSPKINGVNTLGPKEQSSEEQVQMFIKKITEASKNRKRDKNVAMAGLMRLKESRLSSPTTPKKNSLIPITNSNSLEFEPVNQESLVRKNEEKHCEIQKQDAQNSESSSPKNIILFTPEYFSGLIKDEQNEPKIELEPKVEAEPEVQIEYTENEMADLYPPLDDIQESIKKVENWRTSDEKPKPEKPKPMTLHTGPIKSKRKSVASITPKKETAEVKSTNTIDRIPCYVPSEYAKELAREYGERMKAKQAPVDSPFTKLYNDLKARDEEIRKRREL